MLTKTFAMLLCLTTIPVFAGAETGGGGGGICTPASCVTLAEAGLRINAQLSSTFRLSKSQIQDIAKVIDLIPGDVDKNILLRNVLGDSNTFHVVEKKDEKKFEKFKNEYLKILADLGFSPEGLNLLAVTAKKITYILPQFEKLSVRSKTLNLIHEALIRNYGATVMQALKFDGLLLDSLEGRLLGSLAEELNDLTHDLKMGVGNFANEYEIISLKYDHIFFKHDASNVDLLKARLQAKLYQNCVNITKDQSRCNILENTFLYKIESTIGVPDNGLFYYSEMKANYLKSDAIKKDKVYLTTATELFLANVPVESGIQKVKERAIQEGMNKCINSAKHASLCIVQDKTVDVATQSKISVYHVGVSVMVVEITK